jgi:hypothetical protein
LLPAIEQVRDVVGEFAGRDVDRDLVDLALVPQVDLPGNRYRVLDALLAQVYPNRGLQVLVDGSELLGVERLHIGVRDLLDPVEIGGRDAERRKHRRGIA